MSCSCVTGTDFQIIATIPTSPHSDLFIIDMLVIPMLGFLQMSFILPWRILSVDASGEFTFFYLKRPQKD